MMWMGLENIMLGERVQMQNLKHPQQRNPEIEDRLADARGWEEGDGKRVLWYGASFRGDGNVLERDTGDGCTAP